MKNLFRALAMFQQEVPVIHKGTQGFGYSYADLPAIFEVINPLLKKHGLGFTQLLEGSSVKTIIFHIESGEKLKSSTDIPQGVQLAKMNEFQILGSATSYIRRYALSAALGLVTDKDIDAHGAPASKPAPAAKKATTKKKTKSAAEKLAAAVKKAILLLENSATPDELKANWLKVKDHVGKESEVIAAKDKMKVEFDKRKSA